MPTPASTSTRKRPRSLARRRRSARPSRPESSATSGGFGGLFRPDFSKYREPVLVASTDGVGTKLKVAIDDGPPRHVRGGPRQSLRQRHPRAGGPAALLSRLRRDGQARAGPDRERHRGRRPGLPRERHGAARRRDRRDAGLLRGGRVRRRRDDRRASSTARRSSTARASRPATSPWGCRRSASRPTVTRSRARSSSSAWAAPRRTGWRSWAAARSATCFSIRTSRTCGRSSRCSTPDLVHGLAHMTGGGFYDNIPRVLPEGLDVVVKSGAWPVPPVFEVIAARRRCLV